MAIPVIYKGDDTDFRGSTGFTLKVVTSSNLNLSGCTVEVEVLGFRRSFPASATGELVCPFAFSAAETQRMPLGIHAATVRVYDSKGRVRTINNSIRVKVTNSVHEAYGKDDPQEVTLAVSTVDLEAYAKKEEVTAAIEKALRDASASTNLHILTPEVTNTTVTLKPVDGAANHVSGVVEVGSRRIDRSLELRVSMSFEFEDPATGDPVVKDIIGLKVSTNNFSVLQWDADEEMWTTLARFRLNEKLEFKHGEYGVVATVPEGTELLGEFRGAYGAAESFVCELDYWHNFDPYDYIDYDGLGLSPDYLAWIETYASYAQTATDSFKLCTVTLPASTDSTKARRFSLTVETDTDTEKAVEWQGGEVIEAVPGASKLVPGLNVWDVSEVAPGRFKVERASSPAQSAPLTLTAPNGRVAELTVGDDLVIEVKEI